MKIIKPEDFPIEMTDENITILAEMSLKEVISEEWREITFNKLTDEQNILVNNRICSIQDEKEKKRWNSLTIEEQVFEKKQIEESIEDTKSFKGNILEQERHSIDLAREKKENKK